MVIRVILGIRPSFLALFTIIVDCSVQLKIKHIADLLCGIEWLRLNPLYTNGFSLLVRYNKPGIVQCTYLGVSGYDFQKILYYFVTCTFTSSVDPDLFDLILYVNFSVKQGRVFLD